ncbi:MAG: penicillin-binding protein 2 [Candidatus Omnitrophota bacterium]|jgi:penicillin-binding protein 2
MRLKIVSRAVIIAFLLLLITNLNIEVIQGGKYRALSNKNCVRLLPQDGARGKISDRNGGIIVDNKLSYNVMISSYGSNGVDDTLRRIGGILNISAKDLKKRYRDISAASFTPAVIAENIDVKKAIMLEEMKGDMDNIVIQPYPLRDYIYGRAACHIIGYLNEIDLWRLTKLANYGYKTRDIVGFGGVEEKYDYFLRQETGGLSVEVDHRGRLVSVLGFKPPRNGRDLKLTIDLKIQKIAEESLSGRNGCVVLMDPFDGDIMAMASYPGFSPDAFVKSSGVSLGAMLSDPDAPFINRAITGAYPAGSIFKMVVAAAALETGKINQSTAFLCSGSLMIGNHEFSCWETHGKQGLAEAIANSCNVFFYRTGLLAGAQAIHDYAVKFGFSHLTGVDLPYEAQGFVPSPLWRQISKFKRWYDGDTANISIGQGELLITPIQAVRMIAVFANNGFLVTPRIVKAVDGREISSPKKGPARISLKESTIMRIKEGLRGTITYPTGTAHILSALPVSVAGKTGTAQVSRGSSHGWFVGFFPYKKPKFAICVFLEHGGSGHAASVVAKEIIEGMAREGLI